MAGGDLAVAAGVAQIGAFPQVEVDRPGLPQIGLAEDHPPGVAADQRSAAEIDAADRRPPQIGAVQDRPGEARSREKSAPEVGFGQVGIRQVGPFESRLAQVDPGEVEPLPQLRPLPARVPLSQSGGDRPHRGRRVVLHRLPILGVGGVMDAQVGGQHLHRRPVVELRLAGDSGQLVDTAQPDDLVLAGEMVDGHREAIGQLAFAGLADRPQRGPGGQHRAQDDRETGQRLDRRGADVALGGEEVLLPQGGIAGALVDQLIGEDVEGPTEEGDHREPDQAGDRDSRRLLTHLPILCALLKLGSSWRRACFAIGTSGWLRARSASRRSATGWRSWPSACTSRR